MKKIAVFLAVAVVVFMILMLVVKIDLIVHPTSPNGWTYLYLNNYKIWMVVSIVWSGFLGLITLTKR